METCTTEVASVWDEKEDGLWKVDMAMALLFQDERTAVSHRARLATLAPGRATLCLGSAATRT